MTITADADLQARIRPGRREGFRWLARECDAPDPIRAEVARAWAHPSLPRHQPTCLCGYCTSYHWAALLSEYGALDDLLDYSGEIPEEYLGLADPCGMAAEDVAERIEACLDTLSCGPMWQRMAA